MQELIGLLKYTQRRLIQGISILIGVLILSYLMTLQFGGPLSTLTFSPSIKPSLALRTQLGLNDPWFIQSLRWLLGDDWLRWDVDGDGKADHSFLIPLDADGDGKPDPPGTRRGITRGDFGISYITKRPPMETIIDRVPPTFELGGTALFLSVIISLPLGVLAAVYQDSLIDKFARILYFFFSGLPYFWSAMLLVLIFGSTLKLLPLGGRCPVTLSGECPPLFERLSYLILPIATLTAANSAVLTNYIRVIMLDVIHQDYMRTAVSKGLPTDQVWFVHGIRNVFPTLATISGPTIASMLTTQVTIETIFGWPGLGRLLVSGISQLDFPLILALVIVTSVTAIIIYIFSDILYAVVDPRIRID
jgi:ABC-type dipeptide/oligopeptide/nickel transport system permease component